MTVKKSFLSLLQIVGVSWGLCICGTCALGDESTEPSGGAWYVNQPVHAGYQNWGASDAVVLRMKQAGLNTLIYAWNDWRDPADAANDDYSITTMSVV